MAGRQVGKVTTLANAASKRLTYAQVAQTLSGLSLRHAVLRVCAVACVEESLVPSGLPAPALNLDALSALIP